MGQQQQQRKQQQRKQRKQRKQQQRKHLLDSSRGRAEALPAAAILQNCEINEEGMGSGEVGQLQQQQQQHCGMTGRVEGWGWGSSSGSSGSSSSGSTFLAVAEGGQKRC